MVAGWGLRVRVPEPPSGSEEAGGGHPSQNRRARPSRCCSINALTRSAWVTGPMWPTPASSLPDGGSGTRTRKPQPATIEWANSPAQEDHMGAVETKMDPSKVEAFFGKVVQDVGATLHD